MNHHKYSAQLQLCWVQILRELCDGWLPQKSISSTTVARAHKNFLEVDKSGAGLPETEPGQRAVLYSKMVGPVIQSSLLASAQLVQTLHP